MRALLDFLAKYYHWLVFILLEVVSFVLLFQFNHYQNSVWLTTANTVVGHVDAWERSVLHYLYLGRTNEQLTRRNIILEQNIEELTRRIERLTHDSTRTELLQTERLTGIKLIPAKVVNNSVMKKDNLMTISAGSADGVETEMGVVCGTGIVGIVFQTSPHFSIVMPLLNHHSQISCRLRGTLYAGTLRWEGDSPLHAVLDDIPRHAQFRIGDVVETSGYSAIFPPGLFVGRVKNIYNSNDGLSYKLQIQLGIDFSCLQDVSVVAQEFRPEISELEEKADSIKNKAR
ncbi:MAG: rod shape-determining protein MreC [Bacteroidaceae bacterium]|nr:rod shape-determining protein MreC [Bacteroidaceae bacterium]